MKQILITAFEPFGGESINPTGLILKALPDSSFEVEIKKLLLPVEFSAAPKLACEAIDRLAPSAVLMLGQAGGREFITPERVAVNIMDARIPDNAGFKPCDIPAVPEGPAAYFASLPIKRIAGALSEAGLPAQVSNTAGTYVCNALMYAVLHHLNTAAESGGPGIPAGFVHFPYITEQTEGRRPEPPSMELEDEIRAAELIIKIIAETVN